MDMDSRHSLVIGVGNELRGDDGTGLFVARRLMALELPGVTVMEHSGEGAGLVELIRSAEQMVIVDAVQAGGEPGWIHRIDAHTESVPTNFFNYSTHAFSVAEAVEMCRALDVLPPCLVIYGVEGAQFDAGAALSPQVESACSQVVGRIVEELSNKM
jgi:hydrogenase maturation protease